MSESRFPPPMTLLAAVLRGASECKVQRIKEAEPRQPEELLQKHFFPRLGPTCAAVPMDGEVEQQAFLSLWNDLVGDFKKKFVEQLVFLEGRRAAGRAMHRFEQIPSRWVDTMHFGLTPNAVRVHDQVFADVRAHWEDPPVAEDPLPLRKAVTYWSSRQLILNVMDAERQYTPNDLDDFYAGRQGLRQRLLDDHEVAKPHSTWVEPHRLDKLIGAWRAVETDFRDRLATSLFPRGVQVKPAAEEKARAIPQGWATDATFDVSRNAMTFGGRRYSAVTVSRQAPAIEDSAVNEEATAVGIPITPDSVRHLSDDQVLLLLEEHGRRVVQEDAAPLIQPSRVSFGPILLRRMQWRAEKGETCDSLAAECSELIGWLKTKIEHHQIPTAKAAQEPLREAYRRLKPGSRS